MPPDTLRERLTTAFLDASTNRDTFVAYDLADIALKVFEDAAIIEASAEVFVVEEPSADPPCDPWTEVCPECYAAPGETCGISIALLHGYPGPVGDCPRDPA